MTKFVSPCLPPTARQREILEVIAEEAAEVIQRCTKAMRFGLDEIQPGQAHTNAHRISTEVGDLMAILDMAFSEGVIPKGEVLRAQLEKPAKLEKFMQTSNQTEK